MTSFLLKIIGVICMTCDHISDAIIGHFSFLNLIGRIAFPIFAFQAVQGYIYTKNIKKHLIKLFIFGLISQIPFTLFLSTFTKSFSLNIFFTIFLGLVSIILYDKLNKKWIGFILAIIVSILGEIFHVDYGMYGVLLIFFFYLFRDNKINMCLYTFILIFINYSIYIIQSPTYITHYINCLIFSLLSLLFILHYNGKQGPKTKYLFYIFYPTHLIILFFINYIINNWPTALY